MKKKIDKSVVKKSQPPVKLDKKWKIKADYSEMQLKTHEEIIKLLLRNRGCKTDKDINNFLNPTDPFKIKAEEFGIDANRMKEALRRIKKAQLNKERIIVFGDYDADGICSTAIIWEYLYKKNKKVMPYLPDRFNEGYGINEESIISLQNIYPDLSLIICVDNGISSEKAVKKAKKMGIDCVILDHHQKPKKVPDAFIIHTDKTCAGVISWITVRELSEKSEKPYVSKLLELSAIAAVADQVPIVGNNRSIVKHGLGKLNNTSRFGLKALYDISGIGQRTIGTYEVGFIIAPRLNAMGRMENAIDSLRLLCTKDYTAAASYAKKLNDVNSQRQSQVETMTAHAIVRAQKEKQEKIIIIDDNSYHEGVIGLVASKLVERNYRPSIVISKKEVLSKGSARSVSGFNIYKAIKTHKHLLVSCGGHPMAAGFTIESGKINEFKICMIKYCRKIKKGILEKEIVIDLAIDFNDVDRQLADSIYQLEPFGIGNYQPLFCTSQVTVSSKKYVGAGDKHLKIVFNKGVSNLNCIAFNAPDNFVKIEEGSNVDIVYYIERDNWNGSEGVQLRLKDIKTNSNYDKQ